MAKKQNASGTLLRVVGGDWIDDRLVVVPSPRATVRCEVEVAGTVDTIETTWRKAPGWLQEALLAPYPLCVCKRRRVSATENVDGYDRCAFCRNEGKCDSCRKQPVRITLVDGKAFCPACLPKVRVGQVTAPITQIVSQTVLMAVAEQSRQLLACQHFAAQDGEALVAVLLPKVSRDKREGWGHYYVSNDGSIWASHLPPEAVTILEGIATAKGSGAQLLLAWITGGPFRGGVDYFTLTQVKGRNIPPPPITAEVNQVPQIACKLGSLR